jgi:hypothetical protein
LPCYGVGEGEGELLSDGAGDSSVLAAAFFFIVFLGEAEGEAEAVELLLLALEVDDVFLVPIFSWVVVAVPVVAVDDSFFS